MIPTIEPSVGGAVMAAFAVVGGAPLFSDGLRTLRLRRDLHDLTERTPGSEPRGFVRVRGQVALESPLFAPLSGLPCAGYHLEVSTAAGGTTASIDERRAFRLTGPDGAVRVRAARRRWRLSVTAERELRREDALSQNLDALLAGSPEASWLRRVRPAIRITERALLAGAECHVIGWAHAADAFEHEQELAIEREVAGALMRTGTDDAPLADSAGAVVHAAGSPWRAPAIACIDDLGPQDFLWVSDHAPSAADLAVSPLRTVGVALGPLLSLAGLLYLAGAADALRAAGRG